MLEPVWISNTGWLSFAVMKPASWASGGMENTPKPGRFFDDLRSTIRASLMIAPFPESGLLVITTVISYGGPAAVGGCSFARIISAAVTIWLPVYMVQANHRCLCRLIGLGINGDGRVTADYLFFIEAT